MEKKDSRLLIKIFLCFYIISVILDLHIFYNSISTLIRAILISIFFIVILIKEKGLKNKKLFIIYSVILLMYLLAHHLNALNFKSLVPGNFNYSFISECLYFYKMITNVLIFYIVYRLNIKYEDFKFPLKIIVLFITLSIIITDVFKLSYTAYDFSRTTIPIYNWFKSDVYDFMSGSSKGLFSMTNQLVAILLLYLPLISYESFKNKKVSNYIMVLLIVISMMMIGNRLAIYGTIIELFILTIIYFIKNIKRKLNITYYIFNSLIIVGIFMIIPYTPLSMRNYYYDAIYSNEKLDFMDNNVNVYDYYDEDESLENRFLEKEIDPQFIFTSYPYKYDKTFWEDILKQNNTLTGNARYIELQMVKRVKNINNNFLDDFLGLTYSRVMNIFNIEQDFVMQYYSIGIIGTILFLGFYVIALIYIMIKILYDLKNKFNEKNIALLLASAFVLASAYYSGNILNAISMIIPLSFIISILINEVRVKKEKYEKESILGFDISTLSLNKIITKIFSSKKQLFIVNINPLIILEHYKNEKMKDIFNQEEIAIPDGEGIVLASSLKGGNIKKRIAGIDLMLEICKKACEKKGKIFLYGAKEGVALKTKEKLEEKYKGINIVGTISGYSKEEDVLKSIKKAKPDILFVALGSPLQEDFIIKNKEKLKSVKVFMPVGGSFDVISGNLKRAPKLIQKLKLEWLYRMIKEPKRLVGIFKLMKFMILAIFKQD